MMSTFAAPCLAPQPASSSSSSSSPSKGAPRAPPPSARDRSPSSTSSSSAARAPPPAQTDASAFRLSFSLSDPVLRNSAAAAVAQASTAPVFSWMVTIMAYQHRHGGGMIQVGRKLYCDGGIRRFYRGMGISLVQVPLLRLGQVASTDVAFENLAPLGLPDAAAAAAASVGAAGCRGVLAPLANLSAVQQVHGKEGLRFFKEKVRGRPSALWSGAGGSMATSVLGHYTWCISHRKLQERLPEPPGAHGRDLRNAAVGFLSTSISDLSTNFLRVLTTFQQTEREQIGYLTCARRLVAEQGLLGLFGRGLSTRLLASGSQGAVFNVVWKAITQKMDL